MPLQAQAKLGSSECGWFTKRGHICRSHNILSKSNGSLFSLILPIDRHWIFLGKLCSSSEETCRKWWWWRTSLNVRKSFLLLSRSNSSRSSRHSPIAFFLFEKNSLISSLHSFSSLHGTECMEILVINKKRKIAILKHKEDLHWGGDCFFKK